MDLALRRWMLATAAAALVWSGCGSDDTSSDTSAERSADTSASSEVSAPADPAASFDPAATSDPAGTTSTPGAADLDDRFAELDRAVDAWQQAADLGAAQRAAEEARNLVVGPAGPYYGDATGDGATDGASTIGVLPGLAGEIALATALNECVERDVLGGSWDDPTERWAILDTAINEWSPSNNTFPSLTSHPQRVVGWATLTLASDDFDDAHEYSGHARLHVDVSRRALDECG
jgi:hypothetical protein